MAILPLFPEVWLNCNHVEAKLPILHLSLHVIVISDVPPSAREETSVLETDSCGSTASLFLQEVEDIITIRNTKIAYKRLSFTLFGLIFKDKDLSGFKNQTGLNKFMLIIIF